MKIIKLTPNEVWPLFNILNEVCHGIFVDDFERKMGCPKATVVELMDKISKEENENEPLLRLKNYELEIINKSFEEVFKQIEDWEFQTHIGISISEAINIQNKLSI